MKPKSPAHQWDCQEITWGAMATDAIEEHVSAIERLASTQEGAKQPALTAGAGNDKGESVRRGEDGLP